MADDRSILQKIGDTITDIAPGLATACALIPGVGTIPAAALGAVSILGKALGLGSQAKPEEVLTAVSSITDPTVRQNIINAENAFQLATRDQDIKTLQVQLADVQGARDMHSSHEKTTGKTDINLYTLSWVIVVGFFAVVALLLFVKIPTEQTNVIFTLLGTLGAGFMLVLQFFYGTNRSSETKTDMIFNSTKNIQPSSGQIIGENN
jgi:hypothetical protein